jgi:hypothetical protein
MESLLSVALVEYDRCDGAAARIVQEADAAAAA